MSNDNKDSKDKENIEEIEELRLDFSKLKKVQQNVKTDVIPVAVQDYDTRELLIIAYANEQALKNTIETRMATFWSTSRNELWVKGKTSGDILDVIEIRVNCEQNSLLYLVRPRKGGACHTKDRNGNSRYTCYYRIIDLEESNKLKFIEKYR
ncbi:MAG: phosphoribosyl-AMP cyclohydrolase [Promethearchaeota archaeon]